MSERAGYVSQPAAGIADNIQQHIAHSIFSKSPVGWLAGRPAGRRLAQLASKLEFYVARRNYATMRRPDDHSTLGRRETRWSAACNKRFEHDWSSHMALRHRVSQAPYVGNSCHKVYYNQFGAYHRFAFDNLHFVLTDSKTAECSHSTSERLSGSLGFIQ